MHSFALNAEELFNMEYINIDERKKEPTNMVWKQRERTKRQGKEWMKRILYLKVLEIMK